MGRERLEVLNRVQCHHPEGIERERLIKSVFRREFRGTKHRNALRLNTCALLVLFEPWKPSEYVRAGYEGTLRRI